jgi:F-box/TPR repeat protein Pof3
VPNLPDFTPWNQLQHLDITNTHLARFPKLPPTVTYLNVSKNPGLFLTAEDEPISLPLLKTFACEATAIDPTYLKLITRDSIKNGHLEKLLLGSRLTAGYEVPVADEFPASETVKELSIDHMQLNDMRVRQIVSLYPNVQKLDLSGTSITGVAVKAFVNLGVKTLILNECLNISPDAIQWARGKDINVTMNNVPNRSGNSGVSTRFGDSSFARRF